MPGTVLRFPGTLAGPLIELFDESVPGGFLEASLDLMDTCYRESHGYGGEHLAEAEAHDLLGHYRRALIEQGWRTLARRFPGLGADVFRNAAGNYHHTRVDGGRVVLIQCHVRSRGELVRRALFRDTLASLNQLSLFDSPAPVSAEQRLFAILLHGAHEHYPDRLAFADVAFPNADCSDYVGRIDLMSRFPDLARRVLPNVAALPQARPLPQLRPIARTDESEDR